MAAALGVRSAGLQRGKARIAWYANRLAAMNLAELAHRMQEQLKRRRAWLRPAGWEAFACGDGPVAGLPIDLDAFRRNAGALRSALASAVDAERAGPVRRLDMTWPAVQADLRWHFDPVSSREWPRTRYCFDIPHRGGNGLGDVKYVWEINRLQHLHSMSPLAFLDADDELAGRCLSDIESWIDANPPFLGINWSSGIELAIRSVSILLALTFVGADRLDRPLREKIRACCAAHGYWLARYPSLHSSANNHLIAEAGGLFLIGTLMPDLPGASSWAETGRARLVAEVERQIHADGVGAEQSPTYTCFTLEWYLLCCLVADWAGSPFPSQVRQRLERATEHLRWLTDDLGHQPRIGDDDEGRLIVTATSREDHYCTSVLSCLSAWLGRPEMAPPVATGELRNVVFGPQSAACAPLEGTRDFSQGGYFVGVRTINDRRVHLVMDHGPLGHLSIAAHGHADALAIWLSVDGVPTLVDAGTFHYVAGGDWRDHFRSTAAHNTVTVNGLSTSQIVGPFNWRRKAQTRAVEVDEQGGIIVAETDGFNAETGLMHERRLEIGDDAITILDTLSGVAKCAIDAEAGFLVDPSHEVELERGDTLAVITRNGSVVLQIEASAGCRLHVERGQSDPPRGWHSSRFGERSPSSRIVVRPASPRHTDRGLRLQAILRPVPPPRMPGAR